MWTAMSGGVVVVEVDMDIDLYLDYKVKLSRL